MSMNYTRNNIAWLDVVPDHWQILKLRQILIPFSKKNHPDMPLLSVVREKGVIVRNIENKEENHNYVPDDLSNYKLVRRGQFVINKMKAWQGSYGVSNFDGIVSPAYFVFNVNHDMSEDFFNRAIRSKAYINYFGQASDGIRVGQWDLSMERMKEIPFLLPPRAEQDQLVRFLDWKVSGINRLIGIRKKQIHVIEELREKIIHDVLLRGINNDIAHKDSKIAWIGTIPSHWTVIKIKWLFHEADERNVREEAQLLTFSKKRGLIPFSEATDKLPSANDLSNYKLLRKGQLLENRMQAWHGMFIYADKEGCVSPDYSVFSVAKNRMVNVKFYEYVFRSHVWVEQFANASRGIGSGFNRLYTPQFGAIYTIYPPIDEQNQIVDFLKGKTEQFNIFIAQIEGQIKTLIELKSRLISDAVTGKIDVRDVKIPEYEFVGEDADIEAPGEMEQVDEGEEE